MDSCNKAGIAIVGVVVVLFSSVAHAKQLASKSGFNGSLSAIYNNDNNIFRQANSKVSDTILTVSPGLSLTKMFGKHQLAAVYSGKFATYSKTKTENYSDHFVNADLLLDLTKKFNINLQVNANQGHESRDAAGFIPAAPSTKPNKWTENRVYTGFTYGRKVAKAQFELDYETNKIAYTNNNQDYRDRKDNTLSARAFYNLGNKTALFAELKQRTIDYINSGTRDRDSKESYSHIGLRWDATSKISGELRVGSFSKKFSSATETDGKGTSYEANVLWQPKSYSRLTLELLRAPQEVNTSDSFFATTRTSIDWHYDVNSRLAAIVEFSNGIDEYTGSRKDKITQTGLGFKYQFRRWLEFNLTYTNSKRDSSVNTADYADNLLMFNATWLKH